MSISDELTSKLKDASLVTDKALIAGEWISASDSGKSFEVINLSTGGVIAVLPDMNRAETARAIDAAQKSWAKNTGKECGTVLRKRSELIVANAGGLAAILTMEMGKPLADAKGEIFYGAAYVGLVRRRTQARPWRHHPYPPA